VAKRKRQATWAEVAISHGGVRAAVRSFKFAMGWGLATAELRREPESIEEYASVMDESRATAFRDQQAFRKCFPGQETPAEFNRVTGQQARYDELLKRLGDLEAAKAEAEPSLFNPGAGIAPA
jgi:hypothetical protein